MTSSLDQSRAYWDAHARRDPLWAILSEPSRRNAGWDVESFFQTGIAEIAAMFYELDSRGIAYGRGSALDFGCGVGRLTQALASRVERVVGLDVSPRMIELARQLNQHADRVVYLANAAPDLTVVGDRRFDVLITQVVLQHIDPDLAVRYVAEFFRIVRPGGLIVFQWPSHRRPPEESPPAAARVMPDAAYRMATAVLARPHHPLAPGQAATLDVEIANASPVAWSRDAYGAISVGNHWTTADGRMVQRDDGRAPLPGLEPGERCRVSLTIAAPREPGVYVCEIDVAHEGVLWFSDRGAAPGRITLQVGETPERPAAAAPLPLPSSRVPRTLEGVSLAADDPGDFPMHGRTRTQVERLVEQYGGSILHVESDPSCGRDWVSYRYYVRNRG